MTNFLININGEIQNQQNAKISVLDRGFLYGDSVYEATRTFNRKIFRLDQHIDRLFESAEKIYLIPNLSKDEIKLEIKKLVQFAPYENANLRIVLTRGDNDDLGLNPDLANKNNLIIYCKELHENPEWWYEKGIKLSTFQKETSSKGSLPKTGNYIENMLANRHALTHGYYDSVMINNDGHITECSTSNIWIVKSGIIYTPSLNQGVLPGLTRAKILKLNSPNLPKIIEKDLTLQDLLNADECFISSTTRHIVPVVSINTDQIGNGRPGEITLKVLAEYKKSIPNDLI